MLDLQRGILEKPELEWVGIGLDGRGGSGWRKRGSQAVRLHGCVVELEGPLAEKTLCARRLGDGQQRNDEEAQDQISFHIVQHSSVILVVFQWSSQSVPCSNRNRKSN